MREERAQGGRRPLPECGEALLEQPAHRLRLASELAQLQHGAVGEVQVDAVSLRVEADVADVAQALGEGEAALGEDRQPGQVDPELRVAPERPALERAGEPLAAGALVEEEPVRGEVAPGGS